jgi:TolB protein
VRRKIWMVWALGLLVMAAACTTGTDQGSASEPGAEPPESSPPQTSPPEEEVPGGDEGSLPGGPVGAEALLELEGRLAVTTGDQLAVMNPSGSEREVVSDPEVGAATQPTWSLDGTFLAWALTDPARPEIERLTIETGERVQVPTGPSPPIYLQWHDDSTRLGFLQNDVANGGLTLRTVEEGGRAVVVSRGAPLYFSWHPETAALVTHVFADGVDIIDVTPVQGPSPLFEPELAFTAPAWIDDSSVLAARPGSLVRIDVDTGRTTELADLASGTEFVLDPTRRLVAYVVPDSDIRSIGRSYAVPTDAVPTEINDGFGARQIVPGQQALRILDLESGADVVVDLATPLAWEWSPDGSRLAILAPSTFGQERLRWYVWQRGAEGGPLGGGIVAASSGFVPSEVDRTVYLPFFAQYAQSHTRWSPGGEALAFAGTINESSGVFVHVFGVTPQSVLVGDGDFVTWSRVDVTSGGRTSPA